MPINSGSSENGNPSQESANDTHQWYKATVILAHQGQGKRTEGTAYIFATDAADAFTQLTRNKGGIKRSLTPTVNPCTENETEQLLQEIESNNINLEQAKKRGLKSVAPGEMKVF